MPEWLPETGGGSQVFNLRLECFKGEFAEDVNPDASIRKRGEKGGKKTSKRVSTVGTRVAETY